MLANRRRSVGAVNAVDRAAEIHGARAERVGWAAGDKARQIGLAPDHFRGRTPIRPLGFSLDGLDARPGEAFTADANAIAHGLATRPYEIKVGIGRVDNDGARRLAGAIVDDLAAEFGSNLAVIVRIGIGMYPRRRRLRLNQKAIR